MRHLSSSLAACLLLMSGYPAIAATSPSPNGTAIPTTATQIVDGQLNTWTVANGVASENGVVTAPGSIILLLYQGGVVYQENSGNAWNRWASKPKPNSGPDGTWVSTTDPRVVSANGTTIPSATQIVDSQLNIWNVVISDAAGGVAYKNGVATQSSSIVQLVYAGGVVYQENVHSAWYKWSGAAWVTSSGPPLAPSPDGTAIGLPESTGTQIVDNSLAKWTIVNEVAYENGNATQSSSVKELLLYGGSIYQFNTHGNWYEWNSTNRVWAAISADPRVPALAASAGYKVLNFDSTTLASVVGPITGPTTWQTAGLANGARGCSGTDQSAVQNADGSFTVSGACHVVTAIRNGTAEDWLGVAFQPGMYIKVVISYTGTNPGNNQANKNAWPNFWALSVEHAVGNNAATQWPSQPPNYVHFGEADFFEAYCGFDNPCLNVNATGTNVGLTTLHDWYDANPCPLPPYALQYCGPADSGSGSWILPSSTTWAAPHTLEFVYVPGSSTSAPGNGHLYSYVDGVNVGGPQSTWTLYDPSTQQPLPAKPWVYNIGDSEYMVLIAGGGNFTASDGTLVPTALTVYSIQVWQASANGMARKVP